MYQITKKEWAVLRKNHPDYISRAIMEHKHKGKVCHVGDWTCFESVLSDHPDARGTGLIFEHIHFEII